VIVVLVGPVLLAGVIWLAHRVVRRIVSVWHTNGRDGPCTVVMLATGRIDDTSFGWPAAMRAELASIEGRRARWRFAIGCARVGWFSTRRSASGTVVIGGVLACTALQLYGRAQFATDSTRGVGYTALFAAFMLVAAFIGMGGVRSTDPEDALARRHGTVAGAAIGVLFVVAVAPLGVGGYAVLVAVVVAVAVAARTARTCDDSRTGVRTGLWIALTGGQVFFLGLMTLTYAAAGWFTRDPEAVAVFNNFGPITQRGHNLQQWPGFASFLARREAAVATLVGFIAIPLITIVCGALGGAVSGKRQQPTTRKRTIDQRSEHQRYD
jgi:hypothetical protein